MSISVTKAAVVTIHEKPSSLVFVADCKILPLKPALDHWCRLRDTKATNRWKKISPHTTVENDRVYVDQRYSKDIIVEVKVIDALRYGDRFFELSEVAVSK